MPRTVRAEEALALGLATRVVPADELAGVVAELAATLAAGPTLAYGSIRRAVAYSAGHTLTESLAREGEYMALTGGSEDHAAAVSAFLAKEQPDLHRPLSRGRRQGGESDHGVSVSSTTVHASTPDGEGHGDEHQPARPAGR